MKSLLFISVLLIATCIASIARGIQSTTSIENSNISIIIEYFPSFLCRFPLAAVVGEGSSIHRDILDTLDQAFIGKHTYEYNVRPVSHRLFDAAHFACNLLQSHKE